MARGPTVEEGAGAMVQGAGGIEVDGARTDGGGWPGAMVQGAGVELDGMRTERYLWASDGGGWPGAMVQGAGVELDGMWTER